MIDAKTDAPVIYRLRLADPGAHVVEVSCRIREPAPDGQVLSLPAWIPGSYLVRDYARHVLALSAQCDGEPVAVRKLDKTTWRTGPCPGPLTVTAEVYAFDLSVRGSFLDAGHAFVNGVCVFLRAHGRETERCVVHVEAPASHPHWRLATAMARVSGGPLEFGAFEAADYDELIDQPFLAGALEAADFEIHGLPHQLAVAGGHDGDLERVARDLARICGWQARLFGGPLPVNRYHFLLMVEQRGYGGLEHRDSSALICSRADLPPREVAGVTPEYRRFLGLASHEYFHLWNVKRLRPAELVPYRLEAENYTRQLWLFEGLTSYYDDLALRRAELIPPEGYLELLGRTLTRVYRSPGRRRQTLEEASFDAWIKFYRPDENAPNALISYYTKGAVVALALDLELRLRTGGACSLDDVVANFWQQYGDARGGVPEGAFERLAGEVSGLDLDDFFHQCLRTTIDPPVGILLAQFGIKLKLRAAEGPGDEGGAPGQRESRPRPWPGVRIRAEGERVRIAHVLADGPGAAAGLSAGDEILALDGVRVTPGNLDALLDRAGFERPVRVHVFRRDTLLATELRAVRPPRDTAYLALDPDCDAESLERRRRWLGA